MAEGTLDCGTEIACEGSINITYTCRSVPTGNHDVGEVDLTGFLVQLYCKLHANKPLKLVQRNSLFFGGETVPQAPLLMGWM